MNGLLVGRFQPFHLGHIEAIRFALVRSESLWLCIGSSNLEREAKNPFSVGERQEMIESSLPDDILERVQIYAIPDYDDHKKWIAAIDSAVPEYDVVYTNDDLTSRMFQRHNKDTVSISFVDRDLLKGLHIRSVIASGGDLVGLVPEGTVHILEKIDAKTRLSSFNYK